LCGFKLSADQIDFSRWAAHVLADAKNGRRPASDSGISDNTWIPAQKMESTTSDAGRMRRPPKSKALSCFFFPNQVRHDGRDHHQSLNKPTFFDAMQDEIRTYAELREQMHYALREQHPEWVEPNGDCPTCHFYERRFAELLAPIYQKRRQQWEMERE
jgi:hypothetical protein